MEAKVSNFHQVRNTLQIKGSQFTWDQKRLIIKFSLSQKYITNKRLTIYMGSRKAHNIHGIKKGGLNEWSQERRTMCMESRKAHNIHGIKKGVLYAWSQE